MSHPSGRAYLTPDEKLQLARLLRRNYSAIPWREMEDYLGTHERRYFRELRKEGYFGKSIVGRYYNGYYHPVLDIMQDYEVDGFRSHQFWEIELQPGESISRFASFGDLFNGQLGTWWTRVEQAPKSQMQAMIDNAQLREWNPFQVTATLTLPETHELPISLMGYEGEVGPQINNPTVRNGGIVEKVAGGAYIGGKSQIFLNRAEVARFIRELFQFPALAKKCLRLHVWDPPNEDGPVELKYDIVGDKFRIDTKQLKSLHPKFHAELAGIVKELNKDGKKTILDGWI